ncbi:MAG: hypothetical protein U0271_34160 [Polyangiaceae bacterium]
MSGSATRIVSRMASQVYPLGKAARVRMAKRFFLYEPTIAFYFKGELVRPTVIARIESALREMGRADLIRPQPRAQVAA